MVMISDQLVAVNLNLESGSDWCKTTLKMKKIRQTQTIVVKDSSITVSRNFKANSWTKQEFLIKLFSLLEELLESFVVTEQLY